MGRCFATVLGMYVSDGREGREDGGGWRGESLASRGSETFVGGSFVCGDLWFCYCGT